MRLALLALLVLALVGCGVRGPVVPAWTIKKIQPPLRIRDLSAEVRGGQVWLDWTVPVEKRKDVIRSKIDRYVIFYDVLPLAEEFCLTCPLDLSLSLEVYPSGPDEAIFKKGRVSVPVAVFEPDKKYVFIMVAVDKDDRSSGDSNLVTLNWPVTVETEEEK